MLSTTNTDYFTPSVLEIIDNLCYIFDNLRQLTMYFMLNQLLINSEVTHLVLAFLDTLPESAFTDALKRQVVDVSGEQHVSFEQWWSLLQTVQDQIAIPALGLKIGECVKVEHLGCLGYLLKTSRDLEQALQSFERFQRLLYDGNRADLVFESNNSERTVGKLIWQADFGHSSQLSDELLLSGLIALTQHILSPEQRAAHALQPIEVFFTNAAPGKLVAHYEDYFQCPVHFGQPNLAITFPAKLFSLPLLSSDQHLHALISSQAESLLKQAPNAETQHPFLMQLRATLVRALQAGEPTADYVASHLHMSNRSLHRKLSESHLIFRDVLKETRMLLAKKYLHEARLTLPEVAFMLGYSEQSAFNRAFKQWFGQSPRQFASAPSSRKN